MLSCNIMYTKIYFNVSIHATTTFLNRTDVDTKNNKKKVTPRSATFSGNGVILTRPPENGHILPGAPFL
jgi:hypothetical protein